MDCWERVKNSKILWYTVSTLILIALLLTADIEDFLSALSKIDPLLMSLAFVSGLSIFLIWGYVWHSFFRKMGINSSLKKSYQMFLAGNFMNSITPLGQFGGEPVMAYIVSENTNTTYERSLSSVMASDIINTVPLVTYSCIGLSYLLIIGKTTNFIANLAYTMSLVLLFIISFIYLVKFERKKIESLGKTISTKIKNTLEEKEHLISYVDIVENKINEIKKSLKDASGDPKHLIKVLFVAHLGLPTQIISLYLILLGLGVEATLPGIILTLILGGLATFSPTPGGTGTFEAAFSGLLLIFFPEMPLNIAVAAAVLHRITTYWPGLPIGYLALISLKRGSKK